MSTSSVQLRDPTPRKTHLQRGHPNRDRQDVELASFVDVFGPVQSSNLLALSVVRPHKRRAPPSDAAFRLQGSRDSSIDWRTSLAQVE